MPDISDKAIALLHRNAIFCCASDETIGNAVESGKMVIFQKGEIIFSRCSSEKLLGLIIEGSASVIKDRLVISRLLSGDIFGTVTLFSNEDNFLNDIEADCKCNVLFLSGDTVKQMICDEPVIAQNYIAYLTERIYFLNRRIETFTAGRAGEKLYVYLSVNADGSKRCNIKSFSELAKKLDVSRATLYRSLDNLEKLGKIKRDGKDIFLL